MCPLLTSTRPCVHCWSATNKHTPMSPLLANTQPSRTHVSIAGQHPAITHPCLHCWPAHNQHTPVSPLLASTLPARTHVSIAGQHPASTHPCLYCFSLFMKIPRVTPQSWPKIGSLTKVTWPQGLFLSNLLENRAGRANNKNNNPPRSGPRKPFRGGAPNSDN